MLLQKVQKAKKKYGLYIMAVKLLLPSRVQVPLGAVQQVILSQVVIVFSNPVSITSAVV